MKQGNPPLPVLPKWAPALSLRRTIVVWMGAGMLVIVLLVGLSATYVAFETELANWKARLGDESRENAKSLAAFLRATRDELSLVGLLDPDYLHSRPEVLASFQRQNRALVELLRTDANGTVLARANQDQSVLTGLDAISQTSWFRAAATGQTSVDVVQASPADDSYLIVAVPASDGGVVVGRLRIDVLEGTVRSLDLGPAGSAMIIARDGRVLAHTDPGVVFKTVNVGGQPGVGAFPRPLGASWVASYRDSSGQDILAAAAPVSGTDWTIIVQVSHGQVFAASRNALLTLAGALLGLAVIGGLFLRQLLMRLVFHPIQELRVGVERIGLGDLNYRIDVARRDEMGIVAEAVNQMADRLHERDEQIAANTQALRESETRLRRITDSMQDIISEIDLEGNIRYVSPSHRDVLGYAAEQLIGRSALEHLHPDDRAPAIAALDQTIQSHAALGPGVFRYQHADGHYLWLECIANLISDSQGQLTGVVLCSRDITGRREMEAALRQHNEYLSALYATAIALMERLDVKDVLEAIVGSAAKLMDTPDGYIHLQTSAQTEIETVVGLGIHSQYVGHRQRIDEGLDRRVWQSGQAVAVRDYDAWEGREEEFPLNKFHAAVGVPLRSGSQVVGVLGLSYREPGRTFGRHEVDQLTGLAQFASIALDNARLYAAAQQELAERKRAQAALQQLNQELEQRVAERTSALRQSEERLRAIMDSAKDAIVAADSSGKMILWNLAAETMFGYTAAQALGQSIDLIIPERFRESMRGTIARWSQIEGGIRRTFEGTALKQDGQELPVETSLAGWSSQGQWFGNAIIRDITDRKRAEETLAHSERYFRSLIENAFDITAIEDSNGVFTYVSPSVERVLGFTPAEVIGQSMMAFVHPDDGAQVQALFARNVSDGQGPTAPPQVRARHKDGTWRVMEAVAMNCLDDPAIAGIVTNIRDVTERTQAEERSLQSERHFRALVENSWDLVALLDTSGIIQYASPSATAVAGYLPEELVGRDAFKFMPDDEMSLVRPVFDSLVQQPGEAVTLTIRLLHHDGQYRWTDLMAKNMLSEPTVQAVVVHIHDITDRKLVELQSQKRNAHLNALSQMGLAVTMSLDLDIVLDQIVNELLPLLEGAEGISILLREGNNLVFAAVEGSGTDTLLGVRMPCDVGVAGMVVQTGQPQRVTNSLEEHKIYRQVEGVTGYHTQSLLAVPLKLASETIGVLEAVHRNPEAFSEDDLHLLEAAAKWASTAIGNARNYQDLKRRLDEDQALSLIGQALNETLELEKVLQLITRSAQEIIPSVEKAVIHMYDEKRQALYPVAAAGRVKPDEGTLGMHLGEGIAGRVMEQAAAINVADIQKDPRYLLVDGASTPRSLLVAPIQSRTLRSGTISIESALPNAFSAKDESLLTRLGTLASIAIKNAGLYHGERAQRALAEALRETASALGSTLDFEAVLDSILDNVGRVIRYDLAAILLIEQPTGFVKVVRCQASDPRLADTVRDFRMHISQIPNFQIILRTGNSQVIPDVREWPEWVDVPATRWIASHIGIPIRLRDQIIGFLNLESTTPGFYADEHIARLQSFAAQAATALGNAKLYQELQDALKQEQTTRSQLIQSGKLAALGRMAASVAHEFNNPLQTIKNCLYLLQPQCVATEDAEFMGIAISETERLSRLVEQLRSAYRPEYPEDMRPLKLCTVLEHTCALIMPHLKENRVSYAFTLPPGELAVTGVADQLKQVFLNIALNAVDAMKPGGGKLTIATRLDASANRVAVAITDTGRGIPSQDLPHLFDPFFTTKETGMGLGLAITFDIVQKHNGQIEVTSAPSKGSTFTVWLPLTES